MKDLPLDNFKYKGEDYTFTFKNPREGFYRTLIVRPSHLKLLKNNTGMANKDLKELVVAEWFAEENKQNRLEANAKRRTKRLS